MRYFTEGRDDYETRMRVLSSAQDELDLLHRYIELEPHTFLHVAALCRALKGTGYRRILSLGADLFKEVVLTHLAGVEIDVVDSDADFLDVCRAFVGRIGSPVRYHAGSWFDPICEDLMRQRQDVLLLGQVDYLLDDAALRRLVGVASHSEIPEILLLSPSLTSVSGSLNPAILMRDWADILHAIDLSLRTRRYASTGEHRYRRSMRALKKVFAPEYVVSYRHRYHYPSGVAHVLRFSRSGVST